MNPRFPSKVDPWIGVLLALTPLLTLVTAISAAVAGSYLGFVPFFFILFLYAALVWPMVYELDDDALVIRFGWMRSRVRYKDIQRVVPTQNPLSSPALSLDRLHIDAGSPLGPNVSPADKVGFLDALAARAPHLKRVGDRLEP